MAPNRCVEGHMARVPKKKLRHDSDHLQIFMMIYVVLFTFGLDDIYNYVINNRTFPVFFSAAAIIFIGLRLIYTPEALSEHLLMCKDKGDEISPYTVVMGYYPLMLAQAGMIHITAYQFSINNPLNKSASVDDVLWRVVVCEILVMAINVLWLLAIVLPRNKYLNSGDFFATSDSGNSNASYRCPPPAFWIGNNLAFGILIPTVSLLADWNGWGVPIAIGFLLVNTLLDYLVTAEWYIPRVLTTEPSQETASQEQSGDQAKPASTASA